jgi:hypothetical protein
LTRTRFLAAIAIAAIMIQLLPSYADTIKWAAIAFGVIYLLTMALRTYPRQFRERRQRAAQEAADARDYRQYKLELDSIGAKYAGNRQPDQISQEHEAEIAALHDKYQDMLGRKFGGPGGGQLRLP